MMLIINVKCGKLKIIRFYLVKNKKKRKKYDFCLFFIFLLFIIKNMFFSIKKNDLFFYPVNAIVATLIQYGIHSNETPSLRSVVTSVTAVLHNNRMATERTTLVHQIIFIKGLFVKTYYFLKLLQLNSNEQLLKKQ